MNKNNYQNGYKIIKGNVMDKKQVIAEVIELANHFEDSGMISIANRVTDIALKLAYDFNNPKKEEIVDDSLALEDEDITHWHDDEQDDDDDSDKIDFSNIFKELLVDDSLTKDFAFDDDDDDDITSFDEENENIDKDTGEPISEDEWNGLFHEFIVDGDISRSQIEDALSVLINSSKKLAKYNGHCTSLIKLATKHYEKTNHVMKLKEMLNTMDKTFGKQMDLL